MRMQGLYEVERPQGVEDWLTDWLTDCLPACLPACLTDWLTDRIRRWSRIILRHHWQQRYGSSNFKPRMWPTHKEFRTLLICSSTPLRDCSTKYYFDFWLCACMSEGSPLWGAGNVRPTKSARAAKLYKIITQLHPQRPILCEHLPITQLLKSRVCYQFASPIMPWVPPFSWTIRIPNQHSFDPPVRRQIGNMNR